MTLTIVGDEFYGRRAAMHLELPYRSLLSLSETEGYISVASNVAEYEEIHNALGTGQEVAVIVCAEDCKFLQKLAQQEDALVFAGIPRKDQLQAVLNDPKRREEHMRAERSKIATARSIENLVAQHNDWAIGHSMPDTAGLLDRDSV